MSGKIRVERSYRIYYQPMKLLPDTPKDSRIITDIPAKNAPTAIEKFFRHFKGVWKITAIDVK